MPPTTLFSACSIPTTIDICVTITPLSSGGDRLLTVVCHISYLDRGVYSHLSTVPEQYHSHILLPLPDIHYCPSILPSTILPPRLEYCESSLPPCEGKEGWRLERQGWETMPFIVCAIPPQCDTCALPHKLTAACSGNPTHYRAFDTVPST